MRVCLTSKDILVVIFSKNAIKDLLRVRCSCEVETCPRKLPSLMDGK